VRRTIPQSILEPIPEPIRATILALILAPTLGCGNRLMDEATDYRGTPSAKVAVLCKAQEWHPSDPSDHFWMKVAVWHAEDIQVAWGRKEIDASGLLFLRSQAGRVTKHKGGRRRIETFWFTLDPEAGPTGRAGPYTVAYVTADNLVETMTSEPCPVKLR